MKLFMSLSQVMQFSFHSYSMVWNRHTLAVFLNDNRCPFDKMVLISERSQWKKSENNKCGATTFIPEKKVKKLFQFNTIY